MNVRTLRPMLLTRGEVPLTSPDWSYEIKWDGMRVVVGGGRIISRHGTECTSWYPELRTALEHLPPHSIFDGEVVSFVEGRPQFCALQRRIRVRHHAGTGDGRLRDAVLIGASPQADTGREFPAGGAAVTEQAEWAAG